MNPDVLILCVYYRYTCRWCSPSPARFHRRTCAASSWRIRSRSAGAITSSSVSTPSPAPRAVGAGCGGGVGVKSSSMWRSAGPNEDAAVPTRPSLVADREEGNGPKARGVSCSGCGKCSGVWGVSMSRAVGEDGHELPPCSNVVIGAGVLAHQGDRTSPSECCAWRSLFDTEWRVLV